MLFPDDCEAGDDIDGVELVRKLTLSDGYLAVKSAVGPLLLKGRLLWVPIYGFPDMGSIS